MGNDLSLPAGFADGEEHEEVAVKDDSQRNEEHKAAEHHGVAPVCHRVGGVVPGAAGHEPFWNVRACREQEQHQVLL